MVAAIAETERVVRTLSPRPPHTTPRPPGLLTRCQGGFQIKAHEGPAPERRVAPQAEAGAQPGPASQPDEQLRDEAGGVSSSAVGGGAQEVGTQQAVQSASVLRARKRWGAPGSSAYTCVAVARAAGDGHPVEAGAHYEGLYEDGNYYPGEPPRRSAPAASALLTRGAAAAVVVTGVNGSKADIVFLGYGDKAQASPAALRSIQTPAGWQPPNTATLRIGMALFGKYAVDGKWYDAVLRGVTDHGYKVKYTAYGNVEEVPLQYLSTVDPTPAPAAAAPAAEAAPSRSAPAAGEGGDAGKRKEGWKARLWKPTVKDWEIMDVPPGFQARRYRPPTLLPRPGVGTRLTADLPPPLPSPAQPQAEDNDEQKRYKNKIARQIKRKNDLKQRELDQKQEQQSWKQFQAKVRRPRTDNPSAAFPARTTPCRSADACSPGPGCRRPSRVSRCRGRNVRRGS